VKAHLVASSSCPFLGRSTQNVRAILGISPENVAVAFRGLFVGLDRYASADVGWLTSAARDATALYALFGDAFGSEAAALLVDEHATRAAIAAAFAELALCDADDVVVVAFSGHGTPTHELVTYDADLGDLAGTCVPLDTLTEWFARIPARRLICVLDCCFSGGVGAKVLHDAPHARAVASAEEALGRLSGAGRVIITASRATEEAWENPRLGHGLLTYYLLEALQGAPEVQTDGRVSVYRLLEYVSRRVADGSALLGHVQQPTLRGQIDGEFGWPVFVPGALFTQHFPERVRQPVTADLATLAPFGFPGGVIQAWQDSIGALNALQVEAVNDGGVLDGQHLVVVAPTSSGKTMIGELVALRAALDRRRAFFLLPLRALVSDKYAEFTARYAAYGLTVIRATGEIADDIPALMRGQYDLCLMTYEKFAALAVGSPHILQQVGAVVVDELQMIADPGRGANLEFLMTLLRIRRRQGIDPQVIALSGVIGETNGLERWLDARLLRSTTRPIPLNEGIVRGDGSYRFLAPDGTPAEEHGLIQPEAARSPHRGLVVPLVRRLVGLGQQVIVFRETRGEARRVAGYLTEALQLPPAADALAARPTGDPSVASAELRTALQGGVAFHVSDLDRTERQVVETEFRRRDATVRVVVATTTLAMGINTPAESVVIVGLEHPGEDGAYSVAEYKNMVGRAGRLGFADAGFSYLVAPDGQDAQRYWDTYVRGTPEDLTSRFLDGQTDVRSLIVRILAASAAAAHQGMSGEDVAGFIEESFGAFRARQLGREPIATRDVERALAELERGRLVERDPEGRYVLTPLGRLAGEAGVHVDSVLRAVAGLTACRPEAISDPALIAITQATVELDEVRFPLNRRSTQKEPQTWFQELRRQGVPDAILRALQQAAPDQHAPTARMKKAVACLFWITDTPLERIERTMTQFGGAPGGASGEIRGVAQRTVDLLPVVARIAELVYPELDLGSRVTRLVVRLELGVPAVLVDLSTETRGAFARPELLALGRAGLGSPEAVQAGEDGAIEAVLGDNRDRVVLLRAAAVRAIAGRVQGEALTLPAYEG